jgi:nucleotidyltransferase/DNA polymerase involved in DNA repair
LSNILHLDGRWIGKIIFHIDLNSFYPSCEELRDPILKGKAHAVIMTDKQNAKITKGVVASCSYEDKKTGVKSAMPLSKAIKLCPNLILKSVDLKYYKQISGKLMNILEIYSDILEQASIDEAYLDCTNKIASSNITIGQYAGLSQAIRSRTNSRGWNQDRKDTKIGNGYRIDRRVS